ncbi:MAG TPA: proline--tRNA ligase [Patescibacteria group bacterium]|jgi:prolyl-tRNA synthetase|nr:proline--tRNA ligase [Patescibacteria group bacterium]
MRMSQLFTKTRKDAPADEVAENAQLLIRAGFVYKVMAGVYAYTPLGLRVQENIKQIVREEMNAIGGQELIMTSLQKRETWEETGRWDDEVVDIWFKTKLKDETEVGLAWSHEEAIIEMMKQHISSYKDLPVSVYQFQTKLRNELRAKSGIMRGREFVMKDMYSCSLDAKQHDKFYDATIKAYNRVFERLGIGKDTFITFASGGAFTQYSHEFQTICDAGEDTIYRVPSTGEAFNEEIAPAKAHYVEIDKSTAPMAEVKGAGIIGVDELAAFLKIPVEKTTKTMLYSTDSGKVIAAAVRGDHRINEEKLQAVVGAGRLKLADEATVKRVTGAEIGYAGLLNLPKDVQVVVDDSCAERLNFEMGANKTHYHSINVNWGRDFAEPKQYYDIKIAQQGDLHPKTNEVYEVLKSAEVGNIFNFGIQKSKDTDFGVANAKGEKQFVHLGSYGIGITRLMGVIVEKFSDDRGLVWPENITPARVIIVQLGDNPAVVKQADELYKVLTKRGIMTLHDDRDLRAGEKFADADLLGIPHRVVVSDKLTATKMYEYKARTSQKTDNYNIDQLLARF